MRSEIIDNSLLYFAVVHDRLDVVKWLLTKGVDLEHKNKWGNTVLDLENGHKLIQAANALQAAPARMPQISTTHGLPQEVNKPIDPIQKNR